MTHDPITTLSLGVPAAVASFDVDISPLKQQRYSVREMKVKLR